LVGYLAVGAIGIWLLWILGIPVFLLALALAAWGEAMRERSPGLHAFGQRAMPLVLLFVLAVHFSHGHLAGLRPGGGAAAGEAAAVASGGESATPPATASRGPGSQREAAVRDGALERFIREGTEIRDRFDERTGRQFADAVTDWSNRVSAYARENMGADRALQWDEAAGGRQAYRFQPGLEFGPRALHALEERIELLRTWSQAWGIP
jgi:hypothetical protein